MKRNMQEGKEVSVIMESANVAVVKRGEELVERVTFNPGDNLLESIDELKKSHMLEAKDDNQDKSVAELEAIKKKLKENQTWSEEELKPLLEVIDKMIADKKKKKK